MILKSYKTEKLNKNFITEICKLKNTYWVWKLKKQIEWFHKNVKKKDIHNILYIKKKVIGYTLLRYRKAIIKNKKINYYYFDSMIIKKNYRKKNYGKYLMLFNNLIIKKNKLHSFLITTKTNINFYKKSNWILLKKHNFKLMDHKSKWLKKKEDINGMIYNLRVSKKFKANYFLN